MATLGNKWKLAAAPRETPEGSTGSRAQNVLYPESAQDYISQVSEEIDGKETKKLSKEFSKIESRILGALSKLDGILLNPQVRPFNKWRRTSIKPISKTVSAETRNCLNPSKRQCPRLMEYQRNSNPLNIFSRRV